MLSTKLILEWPNTEIVSFLFFVYSNRDRAEVLSLKWTSYCSDTAVHMPLFLFIRHQHTKHCSDMYIQSSD